MKTPLLTILLLLSSTSFTQQLNYCDYFSVKFSETTYEGQLYKSCEPIRFNQHDEASKFFEKHRNRFDYILFKHIDDYKTLGDYFPDSVKIQDAFCESVMETAQMQYYFSSLTPKDINAWPPKKDTFSVDELMLVASRFFYCDYIDLQDTTVQSHLCIGINGQKELVAARDYTLLEAFSGEAIFADFGRKDPSFYRQFYTFKNEAAKTHRNEFTDADSYLLHIRNLCYDEMQHNADLKKMLLKFYAKNRDNLNFELVE